jgi:hypothetical protein
MSKDSSLSKEVLQEIEKEVTENISKFEDLVNKIRDKLFDKYYVKSNPNVEDIEWGEYLNLLSYEIMNNIVQYLPTNNYLKSLPISK